MILLSLLGIILKSLFVNSYSSLSFNTSLNSSPILINFFSISHHGRQLSFIKQIITYIADSISSLRDLLLPLHELSEANKKLPENLRTFYLVTCTFFHPNSPMLIQNLSDKVYLDLCVLLVYSLALNHYGHSLMNGDSLVFQSKLLYY